MNFGDKCFVTKAYSTAAAQPGLLSRYEHAEAKFITCVDPYYYVFIHNSIYRTIVKPVDEIGDVYPSGLSEQVKWLAKHGVKYILWTSYWYNDQGEIDSWSLIDAEGSHMDIAEFGQDELEDIAWAYDYGEYKLDCETDKATKVADVYMSEPEIVRTYRD